MKHLKAFLAVLKLVLSFFKKKEIPSYAVENTLDFVHDIKKENKSVEAEKTLIEAKAKLRERRKATKKIKVPKDID
jgi:hypothetical protein